MTSHLSTKKGLSVCAASLKRSTVSSRIVKSFGKMWINIVRDFIESERRHIMMEDRDFFPAALKVLEPQDWTEIASASTNHEDPLFSEAAEETFDALRARILQLEQEQQRKFNQ